MIMTLQGLTNRQYSIVVFTNLLAPMQSWKPVLTNTAGQMVFTILPHLPPRFIIVPKNCSENAYLDRRSGAALRLTPQGDCVHL